MKFYLPHIMRLEKLTTMPLVTLFLFFQLTFVSLYIIPQGYKIAAPLTASQPYSRQEESE